MKETSFIMAMLPYGNHEEAGFVNVRALDGIKWSDEPDARGYYHGEMSLLGDAMHGEVLAVAPVEFDKIVAQKQARLKTDFGENWRAMPSLDDDGKQMALDGDVGRVLVEDKSGKRFTMDTSINAQSIIVISGDNMHPLVHTMDNVGDHVIYHSRLSQGEVVGRAELSYQRDRRALEHAVEDAVSCVNEVNREI